MSLLNDFFRTYLMYADELWLTLAVGFLISGIFYKSISTRIVERYLGQKGLKPILVASSVGILLPVCCIGSLPIAITMRRKGATLGAVLAFMVATPATSISALLVCWKLLGTQLTVYIFFTIIIMGLVMGILTNNITIQNSDEQVDRDEECCRKEEGGRRQSILQKSKDILSYAFITLPKEIGVEILIGIAIASFLTVFEPLQHLIRDYLTGVAGYAFVMVIGVVTYVCSTASVPMADAFIQSGMSQGQALCYLLVGPITSYATILVIKKDFGKQVLLVYLSVICILSLAAGLLYDVLIS